MGSRSVANVTRLSKWDDDEELGKGKDLSGVATPGVAPDGSGPSTPKTAQFSRVSSNPHGEGSIYAGVAGPSVGVSKAVLEQAVERALDRVATDPQTRELVRVLFARDSRHEVHSMHYYSRQVAVSAASAVTTRRRDVHLHFQLSADELAQVQAYAPEFTIRNGGAGGHSHAVASAMRAVDHRLIQARIPAGATVADVGGDPRYHIRAGHFNVHVCDPEADPKDSMRAAERHQRVKQMLKHGVLDQVSSSLAEAYLRRDERFFCGKKAEQCARPVNVVTAIHVYDIQMSLWPMILELKHALYAEGVMLHSPAVFESEQGVFSNAQARYTVDTRRDKFSMGFVGSSEWWYNHTLSEYAKYGCNQILPYKGQLYSYYIYERRQDTIYYRIQKVPAAVYTGNLRQWYKSPTTDMVEVLGFTLTGLDGGPMRRSRRCLNTYPARLWRELYSQAALDIERGVFDLRRLLNHYRTVAVKLTINGVVISGGERVAPSQLVQLAVDVSMCAMVDVALGQRTTRALTDDAQRERERLVRGAFPALAEAVIGVVRECGYMVMLPVGVVLNAFEKKQAKVMLGTLPSWRPLTRIKAIPVSELLPSHTRAQFQRGEGTGVRGTAALLCGPNMPALAAGMDRSDKIANAVREYVGLPTVAVPDTPKTQVSDVTPVTPARKLLPAFSATPGSSVGPPPSFVTVDDVEVQRRIDAIKEAIHEADLECRGALDGCTRAWNRLFSDGKVNKYVFNAQREVHKNPDFWWFVDGVPERSERGLEGKDFSHAAVYVPTAHGVGGHLQLLIEDKACAAGRRIADFAYTGPGLTTDLLNVYNGPQVMETLKAALAAEHAYRVELEEGPPGCGKTYSILQQFEPASKDGIMCPVRESIQDTRMRVILKHENVPDARLRIRTVDSYLVNYGSDTRTKLLELDTLYADEVFMTHAGKWYAVAALTRAKRVRGFGDRQQIPHISRVQSAALHGGIRPQVVDYNWLTYRCPQDAVAAWGGQYGWKVRSVSDVTNSMSRVYGTTGLEVPDGCVMMCMYQWEKTELRKMYAQHLKRVLIITSHESQGKTYKCVWFHRFDLRVRSDGFSLYDAEKHVLVAMSRHTDTFLYVCAARGMVDQFTKWIDCARDVRRVRAAGDQVSQGESREFAD